MTVAKINRMLCLYSKLKSKFALYKDKKARKKQDMILITSTQSIRDIAKHTNCLQKI